MRKHGASDDDAIFDSPDHRPVEMGERAALRQLVDELTTCLDVCEAMAQCIADGNGPEQLVDVIQEAHDVGHALIGTVPAMGWGNLRWTLNRPPEEQGSFGPSWPDIRERMAIILERLEGQG